MSGPSGAVTLPSDLQAQLTFPRAAVVNRIRESVDRGYELLNTRADGPVAFNTFRANRSKWDDHNRDLLRRLFKTDVARLSYDKTGIVPPGASSPALELERLRASIEDRIGLLQDILARLGSGDDGSTAAGKGLSSGAKLKVFVVHAGDTGLARAVGRFLETARMTPILVTDTPGDGEIGASQVDAYPDARYAIVLVAGDQIDGPAGSGGSRRRTPSPDAIMWLGYFAGRLGPRRVWGLLQPGLEQPGRKFGVKSYEYDDAGGWKGFLTKSIEQADSNGE
jgi:hypothetical protein